MLVTVPRRRRWRSAWEWEWYLAQGRICFSMNSKFVVPRNVTSLPCTMLAASAMSHSTILSEAKKTSSSKRMVAALGQFAFPTIWGGDPPSRLAQCWCDSFLCIRGELPLSFLRQPSCNLCLGRHHIHHIEHLKHQCQENWAARKNHLKPFKPYQQKPFKPSRNWPAVTKILASEPGQALPVP